MPNPKNHDILTPEDQMEELIVAAVNFQAEFGHIEKNLENVRQWTEKLSQQGVQLICFPEMCLSGYDRTPAIYDFCLSVSGPEIEALASIAARYGVTLLAGLAEVDGQGRRFISQVIAGPAGLVGVYRKTHLNRPEKEIFQAGDDIGVFRLDECGLGMQLCYDAHYPELSTLQALAGAEIICVASASPRDDPPAKRGRMLRYLPARAYDNSCYLLACNLVGTGAQGQSFGGVALIINPKGELLAESVGWSEGAALARLPGGEIERLRRTKMGYFLAHRRPDLYGGLGPQIDPIRE
jgi:N-carbamoylputrescine amidase